MKKVVCVGSAVMDVLVVSNQFRVMKSHQVAGGVAMCEVFGGKTEVEQIKMVTGGAGTNVAVGLRRLGMLSASLARVGDDLMGCEVKNELEREGVLVDLVQTDEKGKTGMSVVLVAENGGRSILTSRGVAKRMELKDLDWEKVGRSDLVHISSLGGRVDLVEDVVSLAKSKKILVSMNPGKGEIEERERLKKILKKVDMLIVNRMEAAALLHWPYAEEREKMVRGLLEWGLKLVAVTEGKKGASIGGEGRVLSMGAVRSTSVDDTGAGDAFCAGVIAGYLAGEELAVMLKMGIVNGASVVTGLGAKEKLLRTGEMKKWMKRKVNIVEE